MQKISPHLWFDTQAKDAADFYLSVFPNSKLLSQTEIHDTPSGTVDILQLEIYGQDFVFLNAGPYFTFNPSVSFLVTCETSEEIDGLWQKISNGGTPLMELGEYPFSQRFGWIQDQFGVSWQLMIPDVFDVKQKITPMIMFVGDQTGRAEEAARHYTSIFKNASIEDVTRYEAGEAPDADSTVKQLSLVLEGQHFRLMDAGRMHDFAFNEAISFIVRCKTQEELDHYWQGLSAVPESEQCGWLKDKFGLSWQVEPRVLTEMLQDADVERRDRVTQAMLKMKKLDISTLQAVYDGTL